MNDGDAILIEGDENAFIAAFIWSSGKSYYFVTGSTVSVTVPNPSVDGYDFVGWSYPDANLATKTISAGSGSTTVKISGNIDKTTVFGAVLKRKNPTVTYDLNGGSWSSSNSASVTYGGTLTQPTNPTRSGYAFDGWTLKSKAKVMKGTQEMMLAEGSKFDFASTKVIENLTLKATWKHVHAYAYLKMSDLSNVFSQAEIEQYGPYVHFRICTHADDYSLDSHTYGKNGKCVCGAEKPNTNVTLELARNNRNVSNPDKVTLQKNSSIVLTATPTGTDKFVKWEYRALNGSTWYDLSSSPLAGFTIHDSMRVNAVFESLNTPKLALRAERYDTDGLLFNMQYVLPNSWTAKNAGVVYGDNHMLRYMIVNRVKTPMITFTDPFIGFEIGDVGTFDENVYYYDREDNILANDANKGPLRVKMMNGDAVNIPGYNDAQYKKAQTLGQTSGYAYGGFTGIKSKRPHA